MTTETPLLSTLLLLPVLGAAVLGILPKGRIQLVRWTAITFASLTLLLAWGLLLGFDAQAPGLQWFERYSWNPLVGSAVALGLDGFSLPLVLLTSILALVALLASRGIREGAKGYYTLMLILEAATLGVFMAQDWSIFYVFWELVLIPLFFLINRWGGKNRQGAALNFVLYTMGGSVFLLVALLVAFDAVGLHSFAMADLAAGGPRLDRETQILIFLGLLIGFGVKMPVFPLHGWLPLAHVEAPSPVSILLSGILLKMGSYGLIRAAQMLPEAVMALQTLLAVLAMISLLYGGLLAWRQTDLKAMVAYSSVSHMGVVLLGIAALNVAGLTGALMQMVAHGLVAGVLFLLIGLLYERTHTREIGHYSSLVRVMPRFAFFTILAFVAAVGLPGTAGFIAEIHALIGGYQVWGGWVAVLSLGMLISAAYAIRTVGRLFTGPVRAEMAGVPDLRPTEFIAAGLLTTAVLLLGFFPTALLQLLGASVARFGTLFGAV
jgi:NADH-quinone oxidoreductase subunit M